MAPRSLTLAALVISAFVAAPFVVTRAQDDDADAAPSGSGKLIVSKSFDSEYVAEGLELTVDITLYNVGEGSAYEVSLKDDGSSSALKLIDGETSGSWGEIAAGENVKNSYKVKVVSSGTVDIDAATVSYKASPTASAVTAKSSVPLLSDGPGTGNILRADEYARNHADHKVQYLVLALIVGGLVVLPYQAKNAAEAELNAEKDSGKKSKNNKKNK